MLLPFPPSGQALLHIFHEGAGFSKSAPRRMNSDNFAGGCVGLLGRSRVVGPCGTFAAGLQRGHSRPFLASGITSTTVLLSSASDVHVSADGPGERKG